MVASPLTVYMQRAMAIDFVDPHYYSARVVYVRIRSSTDTSWTWYLRPYSKDVWVMLSVSKLGMLVLIAMFGMMEILSGDHTCSLRQAWSNSVTNEIFGCLFVHGNSIIC